MSKYKPFSKSYQPTNETFPVMDVLSVAVAIDRTQGFIQSGKGYKDRTSGIRVDDNRTTALRTLRAGDSDAEPQVDSNGMELAMYPPTVEDRAQAQVIMDHFGEIVVLAKLGDSLEHTYQDGRINNFNVSLDRIFRVGQCDINKEMAMIVSLPNSFRVSHKRQEMADFYSANSNNGYIGEVKQRLEVTGFVVDVKFIPRHKVFLATIKTTEGKIAKFMLTNNHHNIAGKDVSFLATVKKQEVNEFDGAEYTMFNRVKIN
jgi:hypothetical protein